MGNETGKDYKKNLKLNPNFIMLFLHVSSLNQTIAEIKVQLKDLKNLCQNIFHHLILGYLASFFVLSTLFGYHLCHKVYS